MYTLQPQFPVINMKNLNLNLKYNMDVFFNIQEFYIYNTKKYQQNTEPSNPSLLYLYGMIVFKRTTIVLKEKYRRKRKY